MKRRNIIGHRWSAPGSFFLAMATTLAVFSNCAVESPPEHSTPVSLDSPPAQAEIAQEIKSSYAFERTQTSSPQAAPLLRAVSQTQRFFTEIDIHGTVTLTDQSTKPNWSGSLQLVSMGRSSQRSALPELSAEPTLHHDRSSFQRGNAVAEWYQNGPRGLEQGIVVTQAAVADFPSDASPLLLEVKVSGSLHPAVSSNPDTIDLLDATGRPVAHYGALLVRDASGKTLPSELRVESSSIILSIEDLGCTYPLSIDPLVWVQENKMLPKGLGTVGDQLGSAVAFSGNFALVGASNSDEKGVDAGKVYLFAFENGTWVEKQKLYAADADPADHFGSSVTIDGDIAVIGASGDDQAALNAGAAYVFVRSGTTWVQKTKLVPGSSKANANFGGAVALLASTALVGAYGSDEKGAMGGAVYVFDKDQGGVDKWGQNTQLFGSDTSAQDNFGYAVSLFGNTAVIGARGDNENGSLSGSAYVFVRTANVWSQQAKLKAQDGSPTDYFGSSVSVGTDIAVVGAHLANASTAADAAGTPDSGAAYVFTRTGTTWTQKQRLVASDPGTQDYFGTSVALSGDLLLVGAWGDDEKATDAGATYLFTRSAGTWTQTKKVTASDGAAADSFGTSVALNGTTALIGTPGDDDSGTAAGSAYLLTQGTSTPVTDAGVDGSIDAGDAGDAGAATWGELSKFRASDALTNEYCGYSVAVSGTTILAGAYGANDLGTESGAAYVFEKSATGWAEQARLVATDPQIKDSFGYSVALSTNTAVVGAHLDDGAAIDTGAAYVFERTGIIWSKPIKLVAADAAASDTFGISVAIDGTTILVGASGNDDKGSNSGSVYVFVRTGTVWNQQTKLVAADGAAGDTFGRSVTIAGDVAVIGSPLDDDTASNSGSVYVFVRSGTTWTQQAKLNSKEPIVNANFGISVSLSGSSALIGAYRDTSGSVDTSVADTGSAYVFLRTGTAWAQQAKLVSSDVSAADRFGTSVAISGNQALIGAYSDDDKGTNSGTAFLFERTGSSWTQVTKLNSSDNATNDFFGYSVAFNGKTAVAGAYGDDDRGSASGAVFAFLAKQSLGLVCSTNSDCETGYCVDKVCCGSSACSECQSCAIAGSLGSCAPSPALASKACGSASSTDCSAPDTCDNAGVCQPNHKAAASSCGNQSAGPCNVPDTCDGAGTCLDNNSPAGTACNSPTATECTRPDTCDGLGSCLENNESNGTVCALGQCLAGACEKADSGTPDSGPDASPDGAVDSSVADSSDASDSGSPVTPAASEPESGGCGCKVASPSASSALSPAAIALLLAAALRRRNRKEDGSNPEKRRGIRPFFPAVVAQIFAASLGCSGGNPEVVSPGDAGYTGKDSDPDAIDSAIDVSTDPDSASCPAERSCAMQCCNEGQECVDSVCVTVCPAPRQRCGEKSEICCSEGQDCFENACASACPAPRVRCGDLASCCNQGQVCVLSSCLDPGSSCKDVADCKEDEYCEPTSKVCLPNSSLPKCEYHPPVGTFAPLKEWTYSPVTAPYIRETATPAAVDICNGLGKPLAFSDPDESVVIVPLGKLEIPFFDQKRRAIKVSTNGWLTLDTDYSKGANPNNSALKSDSDPNLIVAPYWDDLKNVTACVHVDTTAKRIVVQWHGQVGTSGEWIKTQAVLNATGSSNEGVVELNYLQLGPTQDGDSATVGIAERATHRSILIGHNKNGAVSTGKTLRFRYVPLRNRFDALSPPAVFDLDGDGHPEVILPAYDDDQAASTPNDPIYGYHSGVLTILNGEDGTLQARPLETTGYAGYLGGGVALSVGDLDKDGKIEILGVGRLDPMVNASPYLKAFSADGKLLWVSSESVGFNHNGWAGGLSLADLDQDGFPEIVFGLSVFNHLGVRLWSQPVEYGNPITTVADLNSDGKLEVVSDHSAWLADGSKLWSRDDLSAYHFPSIADFDGDGKPEIALVSDGYAIVLRGLDGSTFWGPIALKTNGGGPPNIGDFDGDGKPEIGTAGEGTYLVLDRQCTGSPLPAGCDREGVRWTSVTKDISSNVTGSSLFDFEGDGKAEVIYSDECYTRVYSGQDGKVLFETPSNTRTAAEYPLVADIDGDNNAEILVVANEALWGCNAVPWNIGLIGTPWVEADYPAPFCKTQSACTYRGLTVYGDALDNWVRTRPVWSGHAYHITDILADGKIPSPEKSNWLQPNYNNFRMNAQGSGAFTAPDLVVKLSTFAGSCPAKLQLSASVSNIGALGVQAGIQVAFFKKAGSDWQCLGVGETTVDLLPGSKNEVVYDYVPTDAEIGTVLDFRAIVDSDCSGKGSNNECEGGGEANNESLANGICKTNNPK